MPLRSALDNNQRDQRGGQLRKKKQANSAGTQMSPEVNAPRAAREVASHERAREGGTAAGAAPSPDAGKQPRRLPGAARELGLRDFSQVALGSVQPSDAHDIRQQIPVEVLEAESLARTVLLAASDEKLMGAIAALPESILVYRKDERGGEPMVAQDAFVTAADVRDALSSDPSTPHATWGRSLPGFSFALLGDIAHADSERLCRTAFFSLAPPHYRARAAWGLRGSRSDDVLDGFLDQIQHGSSEALIDVVADALGKSVHAEAGVRTLDALRRLSEGKKTTKQIDRIDGLALALGNLRFEPAMPILKGALRGSGGVRPETAIRALVAMGSNDALEAAVRPWQRDGDRIGAEALVALGFDVALRRGKSSFNADLIEDHDAYLRTISLLHAVTVRVRRDAAARAEVSQNREWYEAALKLTETIAEADAMELLCAVAIPGTATALVERMDNLDLDDVSEALVQLKDASVLPLLLMKVSRMTKRDAKRLNKAIEVLSSIAGS